MKKVRNTLKALQITCQHRMSMHNQNNSYYDLAPRNPLTFDRYLRKVSHSTCFKRSEKTADLREHQSQYGRTGQVTPPQPSLSVVPRQITLGTLQDRLRFGILSKGIKTE